MADAKVSALSEISVLDFSDDLYVVDDTGPTSYKVGTDRAGGLLNRICQGRLTLESGVPVSSTDQDAKGTLYFTPYQGNHLGVYDGTRWLLKTFSEVSLSLTLTNGGVYDVFIDDDAATLSVGTVWTNSTTRAAALTTLAGVTVLNSDATKRWLGTIKATATNQTSDTALKRCVWNAYNRVFRHGLVTEGTNSWSYVTTTIRQANGSTANKFEYVTGEASTVIRGDLIQTSSADSTSSAYNAGIGLDSTTAFHGLYSVLYNPSGTAVLASNNASYTGMPGLGYHYLSWNEIGGAGTINWYGDNGGNVQSGMHVVLFA